MFSYRIIYRPKIGSLYKINCFNAGTLCFYRFPGVLMADVAAVLNGLFSNLISFVKDKVFSFTATLGIF